MNNLHFIREDVGKIPFTEEEIKNLVSDEFEIINLKVNDQKFVDTLVLKNIKHPELIDPVCNGIGLYLQDDGGYSIDPRYFKDAELLFSQVLRDLMIDLELDFDPDEI